MKKKQKINRNERILIIYPFLYLINVFQECFLSGLSFLILWPLGDYQQFRSHFAFPTSPVIKLLSNSLELSVGLTTSI
ncbi:MAG: hypothetical protein SVU94_12515, partial [Bacteroidota bacterium]|nr:hypothetical protein [Bacteroidota bacterium]